MAEIKGGITVTGDSVDTMPVILDGRKSLYEEAIEKGTISRDTSYEEFLERLAVKPSELSQAVKRCSRQAIRQSGQYRRGYGGR